MPFYDNDTSVLFMGGKGDGSIKYYEVVDEAPYIHFLSAHQTNVPTRGLCMLPKRSMNVSDCEIVRMLKCSVKSVEPIAFCVPRKSDIFQEDLYPDAPSGDYAVTHDQWVGGQNGEYKLTSMAPGFVQKKTTVEFNPEKVEEKQWTEKELKDEVEKLTKRVAYLEAELVKKDAKIKELTA